jgi:rubrerythrin
MPAIKSAKAKAPETTRDAMAVESQETDENATTIKGNYLLFDGVHPATISADEEELYRPYFDFPYYNTIYTAGMYENMVTFLKLRNQKILFSQLACRKREVISKLSTTRFGVWVPGDFARCAGVSSFTSYLLSVDLSPLMTLKDAFDFAYGKETKALALYGELVKTAPHVSIEALFDYFIESQRSHILFLDSQLAISKGDLDCPTPAALELERFGNEVIYQLEACR